LGGSSSILLVTFNGWLAGGLAMDSLFCLVRFRRFGLGGFMDFLFEDWLERMPLSGNFILRNQVLLLHNILRRALRLQHAECG
jgi:hypothetical protein